MHITNISAGLNFQNRFPHINSYLIDGTAIIDPGTGFEILKRVKIEEINSVFLTYTCTEHTANLEILEQVNEDITVYLKDTDDLRFDTALETVEVSEGDTVNLGGEEFDVIERNAILPSLGLYSREENILFSGHLFIDNYEMLDSAPCRHEYIRKMRKIRDELKPSKIYPAHGDDFHYTKAEKEIKKAKEKTGTEDYYFNTHRRSSEYRDFEHEWNRKFQNPFRKYSKSEKWRFAVVDPRNPEYVKIFALIVFTLTIPYNIILKAFNSEEELNRQLMK